MTSNEILLELTKKSKCSESIIKYLTFIDSCSKMNQSLPSNIYTESHHILPKSIWKEFSDTKLHQWNSINLTFYQHLIAHSYLSRIFQGRMKSAYSLMLRKIPEIKIKHPSIFALSKSIVIGQNAPNADHTKYRFQRLSDGYITEEMTRIDFGETYGIKSVRVNGIFRKSNPKQTVDGWWLYENREIDDWKNYYRHSHNSRKFISKFRKLHKNRYKFYRLIDGFTTEAMSMKEFSYKYDIPYTTVQHISRNKNSSSGWRRIKYSD